MRISIVLVILLFWSGFIWAQSERYIFTFDFEGVSLEGILSIPSDKIPKGIVLVVHGDGKTNAVKEDWYADVRSTFDRCGYATFMWDKMGCGNSEGTFDFNQSVQSSAKEVISAIRALQEAQINGSERIGLWGISRAGWINPLVINEYKDIAFWISVSGVDGKESFKYLFEQNLRLGGLPIDSIQLLLSEWQKGVEITYSGGTYASYLEATPNLRKNAFLARFNQGRIWEESDYLNYQEECGTRRLDEESGLPIYVEGFENLLTKVECPVLALFAQKDRHVDWQKTEDLYAKTLKKYTDYSTMEFPDCNHNFFKAKTGGFFEFEDDGLPWERCDGFLESMEEWIKALD